MAVIMCGPCPRTVTAASKHSGRFGRRHDAAYCGSSALLV